MVITIVCERWNPEFMQTTPETEIPTRVPTFLNEVSSRSRLCRKGTDCEQRCVENGFCPPPAGIIAQNVAGPQQTDSTPTSDLGCKPVRDREYEDLLIAALASLLIGPPTHPAGA
jgi:hypothetical protein